MITIRHTHEDGTLVHGTSKGDGVYELIGPRTAARFRYFPSIRMLGIAQSRDHLAKRWQIDMAAKALREAGFDVTVEIDDTPRDAADVKADRAGRLDTRADRLAAKAERNAAEAERRFDAADHYAERFAGGQPILVGHHSERSARVAQKRIDQNERAGHAAASEAEYAARAAAVVGREEARRERPDVIIRRIDRLEAELRQTMHRINGTRPANDWRGAYYAPEAKPATGEWLEQCDARKTYLEHQLEADRALLAEHEARGYVRLTRETVHKGDTVKWGATWGDGVYGALVTRVNPKTVTLDRRSYPRTLPYEQITSVECPHEATEIKVTLPKLPARRPVPAVTVERPAERPQPLRIDARFEYFPTPAPVVARLIACADLRPGLDVLEPSAGAGAIASAVHELGCNVDCVELCGDLASVLEQGCYRQVIRADFMEYEPSSNPAGATFYDRVIMNPPFADRADVRHVLHADKFVRFGGLLVAVMSAGVSFRQDKLTAAFRQIVADRGGDIVPLPDDAFKQSGTSVRTVLVTLPSPAIAEPAEPAAPEPARAQEPALTLF
jgi:predicted RNA methylase